MTLLKPQLSVRRLAVYSKGKAVYDQVFHKGVNIVRGMNSSGKSTIADFIFFSLGGDVSKWKAEAEACELVLTELEISGAVFTVKREITTKPRQPMQIFWGPFDRALSSSVAGWQIYPFQRSPQKESFSQALFRALDLPDAKGDADSNLTMHQLLRLMYVDQMTQVSELMRSEGFDTALTRTTVGDLLFGIYDDDLYAKELLIRAKQKDLENAASQFDSVRSILGDSDFEVDVVKIQKAIAEAKSHEEGVDAEIKKLIGAQNSAVQRTDALDKLRQEVSLTRQNLIDAETESEQGQFEIADSREFLSSLRRRLNALDEATITRDSLAAVSFEYCPQCLSAIPKEHASGQCSLCKQPVSKEGERAQLLRMRQELALQVKESDKLLREKETTLSKIVIRLPVLRERAHTEQHRFDEAVGQVRSARDERLDALLVERGGAASKVEFLHKQVKAISILEGLRLRHSQLKGEIDSLALDIKTKRAQQQRRRTEAAQRVETYTLELLRKDLPLEDSFQNAKSVSLDFAKNAFAVDGRNWFSASSITYLKNSVHFGIFFASLDLDFFRYPRFILDDNIEDKGMQEARSQNFQRAIVEMARRFQVEHQIIFTTSMIDPKLDNSPLCVGPFYTDKHKSLAMSAPNPGRAAE